MTIALIALGVLVLSLAIFFYLVHNAEEVGPDHPDFEKWDE